nr:hypothetical protein [Odoribacter sp. OF09-27XD]
MEEVIEKLNEICRGTLVDWLGMEFIGAGEDWLEVKMPLDHRTCRPDGACMAEPIWLWQKL